MELTNKKIPAPNNWQDFESICLDLFRREWNDPNLRRHGRTGQKQFGVDIYGKRLVNENFIWVGMQCKCLDKLTKEALISETEKATHFKPKLSEYYFAYAGPRDADIQKESRLITDKNSRLKLFSVEVLSWDDLTILLERYPDIFEKYYGDMFLKPQIDKTDLVEIKDLINKEGDKQTKKIDFLIERVSDSQHFIESESVITQEFNSELNYAKDLLKDFKPETVLDFLQKFKNRVWDQSNSIIKFRILTNMGSAYLTIGKELDAAKLFIEALQYNSDDEKANSNASLAKLIMNEREDALEFAKIALSKNPNNDLALSIIIELSSTSEDIDTIISKIPPFMLNNSNIAYSLGILARKRKEFNKSVPWLKIAIDNDTENNPFYIAALGEVFLDIVFYNKFMILTDQIDLEQIENAKQAIYYLDLAWQKLKNDEIKKYKVDWLINLSNAKKLLKDYTGAKADIDLALKLQPENIELTNQKAILEFENKNIPEAINTLKNTIEQSSESLFLLSRIIIHSDFVDGNLLKDLTNKIQILLSSNKIIKKERFGKTLIQLFIKSKDYEKALSFIDSLLIKNPDNILFLVDKTKILEKLSKDTNEQLKILQKAKILINSKTPKEHLLELAEAFYYNQDFSNSLLIFEKITDLSIDSPLTIKLLVCYFKLGNFKKVLDACESLQKKYGFKKFYTNLEIEIYNEIGDLSKALESCEKYLEKYPEDIDIKIAKAFFDYRLDNDQELDKFLKSKIPFKNISKDNTLLLIELYNNRNFKEEAFNLIYEARRNYYSDSSIHLKYIGFFFLNSQEYFPWLDVKKVEINTAVNLEDDNGNKKWFIIEDRDDPTLKNNELDIKSDFAKKILQKKVKDKVILKKNELCEEQFIISDIKSKYVYALHESLDLMRTVFSNVEGIQGFRLDLTEDDQSFEKTFKPIALTLDKQEKVQSEAFNLYKNKKITLGMLSRFFSGGILNTWSNLTYYPEYFLLCCDGNTYERRKALEVLSSKKALTIDIISLLTLDNLNLKDLLISIFRTALISQSTLELLKSFINEMKQYEKKGLFSVGKQDGKYIKYEYQPDKIKKYIKKLEDLRDWLKNYCTIVPIKELLIMDANKIHQQKEIIGSSFIDTILIAKEKDAILYSDDFLLRTLAESEFKVGGIWTQVFLMFALEKKLIDYDVYNSSSLKLALSNYKYTSINDDILIEAARIAKWQWHEPFLSIARILDGGVSSDSSSLILARSFIIKLYNMKIYQGNRNQLIFKLIESITRNRNKKLIINVLINLFENLNLSPSLLESIKKQIYYYNFYSR